MLPHRKSIFIKTTAAPEAAPPPDLPGGKALSLSERARTPPNITAPPPLALLPAPPASHNSSLESSAVACVDSAAKASGDGRDKFSQEPTNTRKEEDISEELTQAARLPPLLAAAAVVTGWFCIGGFKMQCAKDRGWRPKSNGAAEESEARAVCKFDSAAAGTVVAAAVAAAAAAAAASAFFLAIFAPTLSLPASPRFGEPGADAA